jgi:hypothetical protein
MNCPFPGKDPYLEHLVLWEGVHARLMVAIANQLQPKLDPRYVASIEERVFIEGPQRRIPDVWIQKVRDADGMTMLDLQTAYEQVYVDGRYWRRIRYDQKCKPRLAPQNQSWADKRIAAFRSARPELFP